MGALFKPRGVFLKDPAGTVFRRPAPAPGAAPAVEDAATTAYVAAMTVAPTQARRALIDAFVKGLKADGLWAKFSRLSLLAAHDEQAGRLDLINPAKSLTAVNSPAFTIDRGFQGDGATSYLHAGESPQGPYVQNDAHVAVYANGGSGTGAKVQLGHTSGASVLIQASTTSSGGVRINDATNLALPAPPNASRNGFRCVSRTGANARAAYRADAAVASDTTASGAITGSNIALGRYGSSTYGGDQFAFYSYGASLTAAQEAALYARVNAYLVAIGAAVVAPIGAIPDLALAENSGSRTRALAGYFNAVDGTYDLVSAPTGVSINAATGQLTVNTGATGQIAATSFSVRKTAAGGQTALQAMKLLVGPPLWLSIPSGQLHPMTPAALAAEMAYAKGLGAAGVRLDLDWRDIETADNAFVWTAHDRLYDAAKAAGLAVMWIAKSTPSWVSAGGAWNEPPTDKSQFGSFLNAAANHYSAANGREVLLWEIWNEPNKTGSAGFLNVANADFQWNYPDLLYYGQTDLKAVNPSNIVLVGALAGIPTPGDATNYPSETATDDIINTLTTYHAAMAKPSAMSAHVYTTPYSPTISDSWSAVNLAKSCLAKWDTYRGDAAMKVYMTELGAPTGGTVGDTSWVVAEAQQAAFFTDYLTRFTQADLRGRVAMMAWYTTGDWSLDGATDHTEEHFGARRSPNGDGGEKPVAALMRAYALTNT